MTQGSFKSLSGSSKGEKACPQPITILNEIGMKVFEHFVGNQNDIFLIETRQCLSMDAFQLLIHLVFIEIAEQGPILL